MIRYNLTMSVFTFAKVKIKIELKIVPLSEAVEGDMDQEAVEGAMDGASDGRSDRWYKRWITKQSKEMWIRKLSKELWMVQAMDGAIDGTSGRSRSSRRRYGSGSCRRSGGWCKRWKER